MENLDTYTLKKRDVANFLFLRTAVPGDDLAVGDLLVYSFKNTYAQKLPSAITNESRENELRDVRNRRMHGSVRVLELGYRIIGTYTIVPPDSSLDESWTHNTATIRCLAIDPEFHSLKLSEKLLNDALDIARKWRVEKVCLHVQKGAAGVAKLYERFGFRRDREGDMTCFDNKVEGYLLDLSTPLQN